MTEIYLTLYIIIAIITFIVSLIFNQVSYYRRLEEINKNNKGWSLLIEQEILKGNLKSEKIIILLGSLLWVICASITLLAIIFSFLSNLINKAAKKIYENN